MSDGRMVIEATPLGQRPRHLLRDRDALHGRNFRQRARRIGSDSIATPVRSPRANAVIERVIGTLRRECLDHLIILDEGHLVSVLPDFVAYYNQDRPHRTLDLQTPRLRPSHRWSDSVALSAEWTPPRLRTRCPRFCRLTALLFGILVMNVPVSAIVVLLLVAGLLHGAATPLGMTLVSLDSPAGRATTVTLNQSALTLGVALAGGVGGLVAAFGSYQVLGMGLTLPGCAAALLLWWSRPRGPHPRGSSCRPGCATLVADDLSLTVCNKRRLLRVGTTVTT